MLTEQEKKYLIEKANSCFNSKRWDEALRYYNQLIQKTPPDPYYFKKCSWIHRYKGKYDDAINNVSKAIELNPDDADGYWQRGACYAHKLSLQGNIAEQEKKETLKKILSDYKAAIERNPTCQDAWLGILETDMLLHNWDEAISVYGACKQYITIKAYQLVRAWLGCLSFIFAGDSIEDEDKQPIFDNTIRLKMTDWGVSEIEVLLIEFEHQGVSQEKLSRAKDYHQRLLSHFDEKPLSYYSS